MAKDIVIVGSSEFAKEIEWIIKRSNCISRRYNFLGFIDNDISITNVIGNDDFLYHYDQELSVVIGIADTHIRRKLASIFCQNSHLRFPNLIDPSVIYPEDIQLGQGNIICAGSVITVDISIGSFNIINLNCTVGHQACLHDFITLNPGVNVSGDVVLEDGVNIGTGSQILQGRTIGANTIIGAGAVITCDIPNDCTAVGIPAKVIKDRRGNDYFG
ncbi:MAG: acetyltransferase [Lachnospiraceae bacterium]|nr:acetyltransferase [Lachnospiraceae bacterium]